MVGEIFDALTNGRNFRKRDERFPNRNHQGLAQFVGFRHLGLRIETAQPLDDRIEKLDANREVVIGGVNVDDLPAGGEGTDIIHGVDLEVTGIEQPRNKTLATFQVHVFPDDGARFVEL